MTGGPSNLIYSLENSNFELLQTFDTELRGQFTTRLIASIFAPGVGLISNFIEFDVFINPCQVNNLIVSPSSLEPITYLLGETGYTFGDYTCSEDLACGYD